MQVAGVGYTANRGGRQNDCESKTYLLHESKLTDIPIFVNALRNHLMSVTLNASDGALKAEVYALGLVQVLRIAS